jgi:hypothetical protein
MIYGIAAGADELAESGALPNRGPHLEPNDDERCRAEDDPEPYACQLLPRRQPRELHLQEFELIGDGVEISAVLIDLSQRERAFV